MAAKITVVEGEHAGTELWIEYEVLRFGSDPSCELSLDDPAVEPHALTIRYSDGRYTVFNRGGSPLQLDALTLAPSESGIWKSGKNLRTAGGLLLRLETSGGGMPERRVVDDLPSLPADVVESPVRASAAAGDRDAAPAGEPAKKSNTGAVAVGVLFAAAAAFILLGDVGKPNPSSAGAQPAKTFAEVVKELQSDPDCAPDLWIQLDRVYAEAYRGKPADAAVGYQRLRDRIDWEKNLALSAGKTVPEALLDADAFVKQRLLD